MEEARREDEEEGRVEARVENTQYSAQGGPDQQGDETNCEERKREVRKGEGAREGRRRRGGWRSELHCRKKH